MKAKKPRNKVSFFSKVILFLNLLAALALLISYLAPHTDPRKAWIVAFFGIAYPPILLVNLIFVAWWAFQKSWFTFISFFCIVIGYHTLQNSFGFHAARDYRQKESPDAIRLLSYNVHMFKKYGSKNDASTKHEILDIIRTMQPDVIGFQEFYTHFKGDYAMQDSIKNILNASFYFEQINSNYPFDAFGMAIFSKYPIIAKGLIKLSDRDNPNQCIYIDIRKNKQIIRFYSVHLKSIGFNQEDYRMLDGAAKEGKTDMYSIRRIAGKLKQAFLKRAGQVAIVKQHAAQCPYPYVISGDFNDTPSSYAVNTMLAGLKNAFREKGSGLGRTYNGDFPNYQIDYIMPCPLFNVLDYGVIEKKLSDHYPVYSDLLLK